MNYWRQAWQNTKDWREHAELYHYLVLAGLAFVCISPFLALIRTESGFLSFAVGMMLFFLGVVASGRNGGR